jgi:ATP-dependent protease HslVU (ClpYQ) peptidase subunit
MTTIAYAKGVLAGDSQATDDQVWRTRKVYRLQTSAGMLLVGYCGEVHAALVFMEWLKNDKNRKPDLSNEVFEAIVIAETGRVTIWTANLVPWRPSGKFFAIGSGAKAAMAAMYCGKNAVEAVKIACKIDPYSRGPVHSIRL